MESFAEYLVKKRPTGGDWAKIAALGIAVVLIVMLVTGYLGLPSGLVVLAFGSYGAWLLATGLSREYEYTITNDHLDVDEIIAQRSRKRLCGFELESLELCAGVHNPDKKGEMSRSFSKTIHAASSDDAENAYFAIFSAEDGVNLLIFEPNEKILGIMALYGAKFLNKRCKL